MKMRILLFFPVILLYLIGCGGGEKARQAQSVVDTPEIHYDRGKSLLDQEKYSDAMYEF